jgi:hypothetical protein
MKLQLVSLPSQTPLQPVGGGVAGIFGAQNPLTRMLGDAVINRNSCSPVETSIQMSLLQRLLLRGEYSNWGEEGLSGMKEGGR